MNACINQVIVLGNYTNHAVKASKKIWREERIIKAEWIVEKALTISKDNGEDRIT